MCDKIPMIEIVDILGDWLSAIINETSRLNRKEENVTEFVVYALRNMVKDEIENQLDSGMIDEVTTEIYNDLRSDILLLEDEIKCLKRRIREVENR